VSQGREAREKFLEQQSLQRRLSKEEFLQPRIHQEELDLPALGGQVIIRSLSHAERMEIRQRAKFGTPDYDDDLFTNLCIVKSLVDPELTEADADQLRQLNAVVYDQLVMAISTFNLLGGAGELKKD